MRAHLLFVAGLVATSTSAFADPHRYTRKPTLVIDVKLSERTKPAPATTTPARPAVTATDVMMAQQRTQPIRREQEAILESLVKDTPEDDPQKPDLMFRLAEHYAKQHRFWRLKAIEPTMPGPPSMK